MQAVFFQEMLFMLVVHILIVWILSKPYKVNQR